jgi:hypothetical protein
MWAVQRNMVSHRDAEMTTDRGKRSKRRSERIAYFYWSKERRSLFFEYMKQFETGKAILKLADEYRQVKVIEWIAGITKITWTGKKGKRGKCASFSFICQWSVNNCGIIRRRSANRETGLLVWLSKWEVKVIEYVTGITKSTWTSEKESKLRGGKINQSDAQSASFSVVGFKLTL